MSILLSLPVMTSTHDKSKISQYPYKTVHWLSSYSSITTYDNCIQIPLSLTCPFLSTNMPAKSKQDILPVLLGHPTKKTKLKASPKAAITLLSVLWCQNQKK